MRYPVLGCFSAAAVAGTQHTQLTGGEMAHSLHVGVQPQSDVFDIRWQHYHLGSHHTELLPHQWHTGTEGSYIGVLQACPSAGFGDCETPDRLSMLA